MFETLEDKKALQNQKASKTFYCIYLTDKIVIFTLFTIKTLTLNQILR